MRKYLSILTACLSLTFAGSSQTIDTLCLPIPQAQKVLAAARQRDVLLEQVSALNQRIENLQGLVRVLESRDSITVATYELQIATMKEQRVILERTVTSLNKEIRRYKRRLFISRAAGVVATGIMGYFYLTK